MSKNRTYGKWSILFTVLIMTFMVTLDGSIVNVALPVMSGELNASMGDIEWVASIYLVVTCATILIFGRLGDMIGKVRIFQIGVILFTVGSLLCSISGTLPLLIGARVVQGLGSAAALANNQGIITESFPPDERGKALGFVSTFVALGSMTGPTLGGMILTVLPWTYIFLINIPVGGALLFNRPENAAE
ncbi:MFS transporter [Eubacterium callanderi]|uniref:MFS transporter n=1 Tax=Eubacterium callanderi TaxID=53442 RepID=UPI0029F5B6ED|nr:MFS transporter [Eubacterium callanderi]